MDKDEIALLKATVTVHAAAGALGLVGHRSGRLFCPTCQPLGGQSPDLALYGDTRWHCFKGGHGGDVIALVQTALGCDFIIAVKWLTAKVGPLEERMRQPMAGCRLRHSRHHHAYGIGPQAAPLPLQRPHDHKPNGVVTPEPPSDWRLEFQAFASALPGSLGESYLNARGFRLDQLQGLVGYAAPGQWPNKRRDWRFGRVVFPHTRPDRPGAVVNLYGRAVDLDGQEAPKWLRHDHLPGAKGWFMTPRTMASPDTAYVTEGAFDAVALFASDPSLAVIAIFGLSGLRWEWLPNRIVFGLDNDAAGVAVFKELAAAGMLRGINVFCVPPSAYLGQKDLALAWLERGVVKVGQESPWPS